MPGEGVENGRSIFDIIVKKMEKARGFRENPPEYPPGEPEGGRIVW